MSRYELLERIGVGGMAEIFRGKAVAGGGFEKPVAIKRILPHLSQDKRFVELLIGEAKTLSQLRHRNVVQIYDVGLGDDGQYFLVMEFVDGIDLGALYQALEQHGMRLPVEVALHIGGEVCEALDHAHRARDAAGNPLGLVHRDVTPANILLSRSGEVKLTDFGIAKRMEEATGHGGVRGKFAYIAPEQARNAHVDARSDVYSLAVVLYELITGTRLYSGLADFDALREVRDARPHRPREADPSIAAELDDILACALSPEAEQRFDSAGSFGSKLRSYRYSLEETVADPSKELSRLIDLQRRGRMDEGMAPEPTVVRIATAVGFNIGIDAFAEGGALTRGGGQAAQIAAFDDEDTRAVIADDVEDADTRRLSLDDLMTSPSSSNESFEAETRILTARPPTAAPTASGGGLAMAGGGASPSGPGPGRGDGGAGFGGRGPARGGDPGHGGGDGSRPQRAATPTVRELFFAGGLLPSSEPRPGSVVGHREISQPHYAMDEHQAASRRRAILIAGTACIICAVAAFVVVGVVLGGKAAPAGTGPDAAAVAVDAAPPDAAPPDAGKVAPAKKPSRAKKRRPKKRRRH